MKDDQIPLKEKLAAASLENAKLISQKTALISENASLRDQKNILIGEKSVLRLSYEERNSVIKLLKTKCSKISDNCDSLDVSWLAKDYDMMTRLN